MQLKKPSSHSPLIQLFSPQHHVPLPSSSQSLADLPFKMLQVLEGPQTSISKADSLLSILDSARLFDLMMLAKWEGETPGYLMGFPPLHHPLLFGAPTLPP